MGLPKGYKFSEEQIAARKAAGIGFRKNNTMPRFTGMKHTESAKDKISASMVINNPMYHEVAKIKVSESRIGEKNHNWRGGISLNKSIRYSIEYRRWRKLVLSRDNYTCQRCSANKKSGYAGHMTAHHIKQFAMYPEHRYDVDNGETLCTPCHTIETSNEMKNNKNGIRENK